MQSKIYEPEECLKIKIRIFMETTHEPLHLDKCSLVQ
jgi:hypothetical protein